MSAPHENANARVRACLELWDAAVKARAAGDSQDMALSALARAAADVPADASEAHAALLRSLATGGGLADGDSGGEPALATNPAHHVAGHWDSTDTVGPLWRGWVHGGILTLDGPAGPERFLLTGGRCHVDLIVRKTHNNHTRVNAWKTGLGLTVRRLDAADEDAPVLTTALGDADLDARFFGTDGFMAFDRLRGGVAPDTLVGAYIRTQGNAAVMCHLVRTQAAQERLLWSRRVSRTGFNFAAEARLDFTWAPGDPPLPEVRDRNDPFGAYFAPEHQDDAFLHRSAYLRVISPDPRSRPAIVTYLRGVKHEYTSPKLGWKLQKPVDTWKTDFAVIG